MAIDWVVEQEGETYANNSNISKLRLGMLGKTYLGSDYVDSFLYTLNIRYLVVYSVVDVK